MRDRVSPAVQPGWGVEASRRVESGERGAARPPLPAERGESAHQREPGRHDRPARGGGERPRAASPSTVMFRIMSTTFSLWDGVCVPAPGTRPPPPPSAAPAAARSAGVARSARRAARARGIVADGCVVVNQAAAGVSTARGTSPASCVPVRGFPPVVPWWSRYVGCREAPSDHPGDKRPLGQAGDGGDPLGAVAAVPTAQADREFGHAHAGMGAWMGQYLDGVHACLTTAGVARRNEHPLAVGVVTQPHTSKSLPGPECPRMRSWRPRSRRDRRTGRSR